MGRPLFYPVRNQMLDAAGIYTQLAGMKNRATIAAGQRDVAMERNKLEARRLDAEYGTPIQGPVKPGETLGRTPGLAERRIATSEAANQLAEDKLKFEKEKYEKSVALTDKTMDGTDFAKITIRLGPKNASKQLGFRLDKSAAPLLNEFKYLSEKGASRYELFQAAQGGLYEKHKAPILEDIDKAMEKAMTSNDKAKVEELTQIRKAVDDGSILQQLFPNSVVRWSVEERERELKARTPLKVWSDPTKGSGMFKGDVVQKSNYGDVKLVKKKKEPTPEQPGTKERRDILTAKDLAKAEEIIQSNTDNEAIAGHIEMFNRFSKKPYMYLQNTEKGTFWDSTETQKIELPKINGKQVTARDVSHTAEKHGLTILEVLKQIGALNAEGSI